MNVRRIRGVTFGRGIPKICVPLTAREPDELEPMLDLILAEDPDAVEIRADYLGAFLTECGAEGRTCVREETLTETLKEVRKKADNTVLLFTWRTAGEGGASPAGDAAYEETAEAAIRSGYIDLIDLERKRIGNGDLVNLAKEKGVTVLLSAHFPSGTPSEAEIVSIFLKMEEEGADIAKIAVMPGCEEDTERLIRAALRARKMLQIPMIAIAMGDKGLKTRTEAERIGSCLTFGAVGKASAPGQPDVSSLRKLLLAFHEKFV